MIAKTAMWLASTMLLACLPAPPAAAQARGAAGGQPPAACRGEAAIPPGAAAAGFTRQVIRECPTLHDLSLDGSGIHRWYSGQWYADAPSLDHYSMHGDVIAISTGGHLVSMPRDFGEGALPLLAGEHGFYVEFEVRLSDQHPSHWPAVWLMPWEHNPSHDDVYEGDPPNYQRFMELDVDEGGFGPGHHGTVISWEGIWPDYTKVQNYPTTSDQPLDRTVFNTFGASYQPATRTVTWWVNGEKVLEAGPPAVPEVGSRQNFYLILSAQTREADRTRPYMMYVRRVDAWVPPESPLPGVSRAR